MFISLLIVANTFIASQMKASLRGEDENNEFRKAREGECTAANCKACVSGQTDKCETCEDGYRLNAEACEACTVTNCKTCNDNPATCTNCKESFTLSENKCVASSTPTPPSACTIANCKTCNSDNSKCLTCNANFLPNAAGSCETCSDATKCANCATASAANVCATCNDGYRLNAEACEACTVANCKTCDASKDTCKTCKEGFGLIEGKCIACEIKDCGVCNGNKATCSECKDGFGPVSNPSTLATTACKACPTGCESCLDLGLGLVCDVCSTKTLVPVDNACVENKVCTKDTTSGTCAACKNGYMHYHGACLSSFKANSMGICSTKNQFLVGEALVCRECKKGFVPIDGVCTPIGEVNKGTGSRAGENVCMKTDGTTPVDNTATKCEKCSGTNYFLLNGGCYPTTADSIGSQLCKTANASGYCTTAATNAPFPLTDGVFTLCPTGCGKCSDANTCTTCGFGYYNSASTGTTCTSCSSVLSGCTTCTKDACTTCWDGSSPTSNKCPAPPSASSGLSGGAIAGIVIAVLLVLGGLGGFLGWWFGCRGK